jgi:hypothetical protein
MLCDRMPIIMVLGTGVTVARAVGVMTIGRHVSGIMMVMAAQNSHAEDTDSKDCVNRKHAHSNVSPERKTQIIW